MKITGIIAEYNPFHNGHKFHIQEAKRLSNADATIIVMSGNYVHAATLRYSTSKPAPAPRFLAERIW